MRLNIYNSLLGLCVATAAVSCSNELVDSDFNHVGGEETDMISFVVAENLTRGGSFGNRPGTSTRGAVIGSKEDLEKNNFVVYGNVLLPNYSTPTRIFNGTEVSHDGSGWKYSGTQYWISNSEYNFAAIYPATANAIKNLTYTDNSLSFTYSPKNYTESEDILTATHHRFYESGEPSKVAFDFQHIFSRINFVAKVNEGSGETFVIDRLALVNVATTGTYTITPENVGSAIETNDFYSEWTNLSEKTNTLFEYTKGIEVSEDKPFVFFPDNECLMVIPQSISKDLELQITYHVKGSNDPITPSPTKMYTITQASHGAKWLRGLTYTYNFSLGDNESIIFNAPTVQDWTDYEGGNYIIQ